MAQALALSFIDQLCQASRERPTQIIDLIIPIYMPGTLSEHTLEFLTHGVYAATFLQGVLSKKTPGPCHRCFVQENVRNVRWLAARVVTCHGAKAVLPARLLVVADNVASRRLEKKPGPLSEHKTLGRATSLPNMSLSTPVNLPTNSAMPSP